MKQRSYAKSLIAADYKFYQEYITPMLTHAFCLSNSDNRLSANKT